MSERKNHCDDSLLRTSFCGFTLENPFLLSSSCVSQNYEMCARALSMGWAGVVWKTSGVYRPVELSPRFGVEGGGNGLPFTAFRNLEQISERDYRENFADMARVKRNYPGKLVVASLMGRDEGEWELLAGEAAGAGVDAIEANVSCPQMGDEGMGMAVSRDLYKIRRICEVIGRTTTLPLFVKLSPEGNLRLTAETALSAGADGLTAVNTFPSLTAYRDSGLLSPDICGSSAVGGLSGRAVRPSAMRCVAELAAQWPGVPILATGGCATWKDARDYLALGAAAVQITTAVMEYGYRIVGDLAGGLAAFLRENHYDSAEDYRGSALTHLSTPEQLKRGRVRRAIICREACVGCGRCYLSCRDGGHQAIRWESGTRTAEIDREKCVGCGLCALVCPVCAITQEETSEDPGPPCAVRDERTLPG